MNITIDRAEMKRKARMDMQKGQKIYLIALGLICIRFVLGAFNLRLEFPELTLQNFTELLRDEAFLRELLLGSGAAISIGGELVGTAMQVMGSMLHAGFALACLKTCRGLKTYLNDLFGAFSVFLRMLCLIVLRELLVAFASLLLIVPGIILSYRYSFALYLLLDDPGKTPVQCLYESRLLTDGHKGELFVLDLSMIGWGILSMIPFVGVYAMPFMEMTRQNYYLVLSGSVVAPSGSLCLDGENADGDDTTDAMN